MMCKYVVKKLPSVLRYVPDQYKTQQVCDKSILENGGTLKSIPDCYKNQEICNNTNLIIIYIPKYIFKSIENNLSHKDLISSKFFFYNSKIIYPKIFRTI